MYTSDRNSTRLNSSHIAVSRMPSSAWSSDVCSSDRKSTRLNSSHIAVSRMPSSACKKNNLDVLATIGVGTAAGVLVVGTVALLVGSAAIAFVVLRRRRRSFFFTDTATTEIYTPLYTLSLHDALPISLTVTADPAATAVDPQALVIPATTVDRKSTRLNSSHIAVSRMPSSAGNKKKRKDRKRSIHIVYKTHRHERKQRNK